MKNNLAAIVLAAGSGTRMKSKLPKVLHKIGNLTIIERSIAVIREVNPTQIILVINPKFKSTFEKILNFDVHFANQQKPLGTADAVSCGLKNIKNEIHNILVIYGADLAFMNRNTIEKLIEKHNRTNSAVTLLTANLDNPTGSGRIIRKNTKIVDIIEEKDANSSVRKIKEVNVGIYIFNKDFLLENLPEIKPSAVTSEKYLVDIVKIAVEKNSKINTVLLKDTSNWIMIDTQKDLKKANEKYNKRVHFMGAAGAGASAVAQLAKGNGYEVSGCDINPQSSYVENSNLEIKKGHNATHIRNVGMLVVSPAISKFDAQNEELKEAKRQRIPTLTWQEFQGNFLQKDKYVISIAGAYGKSTTTAMISQVLIDSGFDPTCELGATVINWGKNFRVGKSEFYVNEADEYNNNFLNYHPNIAVILNIAWDHPDFFKSEKSVENSYKRFIGNIKKDGYLIIGNDKRLKKLSKTAKADVNVIILEKNYVDNLSIIGKFRESNASFAQIIAQIFGIDDKIALKSIQNFKGAGRRLEFKGRIGDVKVYDDYAVQPFTIFETANALKEKFPGEKLTLVLEPHTFSRIKAFFKDFVKILKEVSVDEILITDVYAAREKGDKKTLAKNLARSIGHKAKFTGSVEDTAALIKRNLKSFEIILSMGAGNIYKLYNMLKI